MSANVNNNAGSEANDGQRDKGKNKMSAEDVAHEEARCETQHALAEVEANEAEKRLQDEEMAKLLRRRIQETKEEEERLKRMIDLLEHTSAGDCYIRSTSPEFPGDLRTYFPGPILRNSHPRIPIQPGYAMKDY